MLEKERNIIYALRYEFVWDESHRIFEQLFY